MNAVERRKKSNLIYREREENIFRSLPKEEQEAILEHRATVFNKSQVRLPNEHWIDIIGWEGLYQISNLCRIRNSKGEILIPHLHHSQYFTIALKRNRVPKYYIFSRLIAIHFKPNPHNKKEVNHKNLIRTDNRICNIEWSSSKENAAHKILLDDSIRKRVIQMTIDGNEIKEWPSINEAARFLRKSPSGISLVCSGKNNYAYGFKWKYAA